MSVLIVMPWIEMEVCISSADLVIVRPILHNVVIHQICFVTYCASYMRLVHPQVTLYCTAEVPASDLFRTDTRGTATMSDESRELYNG